MRGCRPSASAKACADAEGRRPQRRHWRPDQKDKLWFYGSIRRQNNTVTVAGSRSKNPGTFGQLTSLQNATYKLSYQLSQNNRLSHYVQYGRKLMPNAAARHALSLHRLQPGQRIVGRQPRMELDRQPEVHLPRRDVELRLQLAEPALRRQR